MTPIHTSKGVTTGQPAERDEPWAELLEQVRAGSQDAATRFYERYERRVILYIRVRFLRTGNALRREIDSDDLAQIAWRRVYEAVRKGEVLFRTEGELVRFLLTVTANCCRMEIRSRVEADKRSIRHVVPLNASHQAIPGRAPDPAEAVALADSLQKFVQTLPRLHRTVILYRQQGMSVSEFAQKLSLGVRTIERMLERQRRRWLNPRGGG
jgi:RNA polymerase sigma factor (sigma-70 family)